jgi:hypothetical protein
MSLRRLLALVTAVVALASCGGSGYDYVANRKEGVFFKVPDDWRVFETDELLEPEEAVGSWVRGFDAAAVPSPERVFAVGSSTPRGFAEVRVLSQAERQQTSLTSLRALGFGTDDDGDPLDPFVFAEENPDKLRILDYDELVVDGARGIRLRFSAVGADGVEFTLDQTVLVDHST